MDGRWSALDGGYKVLNGRHLVLTGALIACMEESDHGIMGCLLIENTLRAERGRAIFSSPGQIRKWNGRKAKKREKQKGDVK
jgi:hypothetical protein